MRVLLLTIALLAIPAQGASAEEASKDLAAPHNCPLFVLVQYPTSALYYCDHFATSSCVDAAAGYLFASMSPVPYQLCPAHCNPPAKKIADGAKAAPTFDGIENKVPHDYMHDPKVVPSPTGGVPITGLSLGVNKARDCHFVKFKAGNSGPVHYVKVIEMRFNRSIEDGSRKVTDKEATADWESYFVGYETTNPTSAGFTVHSVIGDADSLSNKVWQAKIEHATGKAAPIVIFLAK